MTGNLRNVLFRLLSALNTLVTLRDALQAGQLDFSEQEKLHIQALIDFLLLMQQDSHTYLTDPKIDEDKIGAVFINFLTGLSLTQDQWLSRGPAYAMANVALDNSVWTQAIRNFNQDKEEELKNCFSKWISFLDQLQKGKTDPEMLDKIKLMLDRFENTAILLEQTTFPNN